MTSSINMLLKKFRDTVTVDRRQGSDRPRSARTDEKTDQVNDMLLSQEDQPELTAQSVKYHGRQAMSSVVRIIRKDLQLKCFKRRRAPETNCSARKLFLKKFFQVCRRFHLLYR